MTRFDAMRQREREEAEEQRQIEEEAAAKRRAQVEEWRVRAQVARDEVIAGKITSNLPLRVIRGSVLRDCL